MVNIGYRLARIQGKLNRNFYQAFLPQIVKIPIAQTQEIPIDIYSLFCLRDLPEQVANIRSFLRHVGIPKQFTAVFDGELNSSLFSLLHRIHPCVRVIPLADFIGNQLPNAVYDYARQNPMGKKLATILSIPRNNPAIYTDSDILFFPGALSLVDLIAAQNTKFYYLPDEAQALDTRILSHESERLNPINGGFILFKNTLDWTLAMERFLNLKEPPNYFTEQTMVHLTLHHNQALPLSPQHYIMERDDEFIYSDKYAGKTIVLRHYVSPVRHKFWHNLKSLI
ncbi:hypothetical protein [Lusitaniella coriacea]|uniref:hypothetical protein n=1 Tax=Lusitaniella coriacea TaxID=1983105 RepID=UPI003CEA1A2B